MYYPVTGKEYAYPKQIQDSFVLDDSDVPGFIGWTIDGHLYQRPFIDKLPVEKDYIALMSCYNTYELTYDSNGGTGTMDSYSHDCATYVNELLEVETTAEDVALKENAFKKSFTAPDDHLHYPMNFYRWAVDNTLLQPGQTVKLKQDIKAIAQWRYPVLYDAVVRGIPVAAAKLTSYGKGDTIQQQRMSFQKTLEAKDVRDGFVFNGWYDADDKFISKELTYDIQMQQKSDSYQITISKAQYTAKFSYDDRYTIVISTDDQMATKLVNGMLKRSYVLGMSFLATAAQVLQQREQDDESEFVTVRAI